MPACAVSKETGSIELQVSVFNASPALLPTIEASEKQAGRLLRDAGIRVIWLNCPRNGDHSGPADSCSDISFPSHLSLQIVRRPRDPKVSLAGMSYIGTDKRGCYADLFFESIEQMKIAVGVAPEVVLGHAMAHELGHLLMGTSSHSARGIMRARWTIQDLADASKGRLQFSREERLRMRNRLHSGAIRDSQGRNIEEITSEADKGIPRDLNTKPAS